MFYYSREQLAIGVGALTCRKEAATFGLSGRVRSQVVTSMSLVNTLPLTERPILYLYHT